MLGAISQHINRTPNALCFLPHLPWSFQLCTCSVPASHHPQRGIVPPPPGIATLSITDFGAVPNDNCSDHEAFRAAAAWINARGGYTTLTMPDGEFIVGHQWFGPPVGECPSCFIRYSIPLNLSACNRVDIHGGEHTVLRIEDCMLYGRFVKVGGAIHAKVDVNCTYPAGPWSEVAQVGQIFYLDNCTSCSITDLDLDGNIDNAIIGGKYNHDAFQIAYDGMILASCRNIYISDVNIHHFGRDGLYLCSGDPSDMQININGCSFYSNCRLGMTWGGGSGLTVTAAKFSFNGIGRISSNPASGFDAEKESTPYCLVPSTVSNGIFNDCYFIGNKFCGFISDQPALNTNNILFNNCLFQTSSSPDSYCSWQKSKAIGYSNCTFYGRVGPCFDASVAVWPPTGQDVRTKFTNCKMLEENKLFAYIQNPSTTVGPGCEYFPNILEIDAIAGRVVFDHCEITVNCNGRVWLRGKSNAGCLGCPPYANAIDMIGCKIKSNGREVCSNPSFSEPFTFNQINLNGAYTGVLAPSAKRPPGIGTYYWGPGITYNGTFGFGTFPVPPFSACKPLYTDPPTTLAIICGQTTTMPIPFCADETENLISSGMDQFNVQYVKSTGLLVILDNDDQLAGGAEQYDLYDAAGRMIQRGVLIDGVETISVPSLDNGIYLLRFTKPEGFARFQVLYTE